MSAVLLDAHSPPRRSPETEVFTPSARRFPRAGRLVGIARAPLGMYTVPVLLVVVW